MSEICPDGTEALAREPNAIGWIAFLILVVSIGVGTIIFDDGGIVEIRGWKEPAIRCRIT